MTEVQALTRTSLLCRIGSRTCALPLDAVAEIMRPLPVEPLAGMPEFVLGVSLIRGIPTPVVDASALLGGALQDSDPRLTIARFVRLRLDNRQVALAVSDVIGVRALPEHALAEVPPLLRDTAHQVVAAMGALDPGLLLVLRAAAILPDEVWPAMDAEAASP